MRTLLTKEEKRERARIRWRKWAEKNREHLRATQREWKKNNPDKVVASNKRYAASHPEKITEKWKRHQSKFPEKCAARSKKYRDKNQDKVRKGIQAYFQTPEGRAARVNGERRRRARKMGSEIMATSKQIKTLLEQAKRCCYCGVQFDERCAPTLEHKIPLAKGGSHSMDNLAASCGPCNSKKGTKLPEEFMVCMTTGANETLVCVGSFS